MCEERGSARDAGEGEDVERNDKRICLTISTRAWSFLSSLVTAREVSETSLKGKASRTTAISRRPEAGADLVLEPSRAGLGGAKRCFVED